MRIEASAEGIERFLRDENWRFSRLTEDTWQVRLRTHEQTFPVLLRLEPNGWVSLVIAPYLSTPEDKTQAKRLYERLLRLNQEIFFAKFSIDDDFHIVLSAGFPTPRLDDTELSDAFAALGVHAAKHFEELSALAT